MYSKIAGHGPRTWYTYACRPANAGRPPGAAVGRPGHLNDGHLRTWPSQAPAPTGGGVLRFGGVTRRPGMRRPDGVIRRSRSDAGRLSGAVVSVAARSRAGLFGPGPFRPALVSGGRYAYGYGEVVRHQEGLRLHHRAGGPGR